MDIILDWVMITISTIIMYKVYKNIIYFKNSSIANYIIAIIYVFCVLPIILNYFIGIPSYSTVYWYKPFIKAMNNSLVNVIYDIYILLIIVILYVLFATKKVKVELKRENTLTSLFKNNKIIALLLIVSPLIVILCTGTLKNYTVYNVSSARGFSESSKISLVTPTLLLSTITFFSVCFKDNFNFKKVVISLIYFICIVWISGKRFMIANILVLMIFYAVNSNLKNKARKKMFKCIPILGVLLIVFSSFYLIAIRPLSDTSFESVYEMLRVDFGRDDVIKYVINEEIINNRNILEYRGETFVSLLLFFIPRKIWPNKPYPHYMYLTASILGLNISKLPAGTTPSLLEMTICNFGIFGFFLGGIILCVLTYLIDRCKDIDRKAILLILSIVLLTQSMDSYIVFIFLLILMRLFMLLFKNKSIKFIIGGKVNASNE